VTVVRDGTPSQRNQLGVELAKKALERHGFTGVRLIQEDERLFELKDGRKRRLLFGKLLAARKRKKYVFEVVTRTKNYKNGEFNPRYILVKKQNAGEIFGKDSPVESLHRGEPRWIAVRFDIDSESYCIYTWDLTALSGLGIPMQEEDVAKYECLARDRTLLNLRIHEG
jgi:hypothetical protein